MIRYPWPGNVRELRNLVERAHLLSHDQLVRIDDLLPRSLHRSQRVMASNVTGLSVVLLKPNGRQ
ncbi:hypothetical protein HED51_22540 [Ochrobactrum grignonense]|nr:hypothetical protein [Brucella grignonensis]